MRQTFVILTGLILLTACSRTTTPSVPTDSSSSSSIRLSTLKLVRPAIATTWTTSDISALRLRFDHPRHWGTIIESQDRNSFDDREQAFAFSRQKTNTAVRLFALPYDVSGLRYEKTCEDPMACEQIGRHDLIAERDEIATSPDLTMSGTAVRMREYYGADAGVTVRTYTFFTATHRITVFATYDIIDLYKKAYDDAVARGESPSILEIVRKDIGTEQLESTPITAILSRHPETHELRQFYENVEKTVRSVRDSQ